MFLEAERSQSEAGRGGGRGGGQQSRCSWALSTHLLGKGMVGAGLGTVGIGIGRGPLPGTWTPAAMLRPRHELLPSGSAGRGFCGGLGLSKS